MKRALVLIIFILGSSNCYGQAYIAMPSDSATWRYRIYDADYLVQVIDFILYLNGTDTIANGHTYHKIYSRQCRQEGPIGFNPPLVAEEATSADTYFGAIRESSKQVFELEGSLEQLIYDFTVAVSDSIPAYSGKDKVVSIDSVLLTDGLYHKRYLTTDSNYSVIEGVGSSLGLLPGLNDGGGATTFICMSHDPLAYSPDTALPCTYIYPLGYDVVVTNVNVAATDVSIFPVPAETTIDVSISAAKTVNLVIFNELGQIFWSGDFSDKCDINVQQWPRGIYYLHTNGPSGSRATKMIILD